MISKALSIHRQFFQNHHIPILKIKFNLKTHRNGVVLLHNKFFRGFHDNKSRH